jgi:predicted PurR-regulated permease PerM
MPQNDPNERPYDLDRVVRLVLAVATLIGLLWLVRYLSDVLVPFAVAILLAYLINPIVSTLDSRLNNRVAASLITVFGVLAVLAALIVIAVPILAGELSDFADMARQLRADAASGVSSENKPLSVRYDAFVASQGNQTVRHFLEHIKETVTAQDLDAMAVQAARRIAPGVWNFLSGALSLVMGLTGLVIVLLYVVFLSIDYPRLSRVWREYLPPRQRDLVAGLLTDFLAAMSQYFRGQFLIAATVGVLFAIGFSLIGLRMGIVLGLFVGALNMIPYLQTVGLVPAMLLGVIRAVEHGSSVVVSLGLVLIVFAVIQLAQDAILTPRIMGKTTGLRPVVLLLSVFVWGKLLGFLGLVLAIPLSCMGIALYQRWILGRAPVRPTPE